MHQAGEHRPFVDDLMGHVANDIQDLEPLHVCTYYEAVGYMISSAPPDRQPPLVQRLLAPQTERWQAIIQSSQANPAMAQQPHVLKEISQIIRLHERVTVAVGPHMSPQIQLLYHSMLLVYKAYSEQISAACAANGPGAMNWEAVRMMRRVKRDVLRLVSTLVTSTAEQA